MPKITIELLEGSTPEFREGVSAAIHRAMMDVLATPKDHLFHVYHEIPAGFLIRDEETGLPRGEHLMFITLYLAPRGEEVMSKLQSEIVAQLATAGVTSEEICLVVVDAPGPNWWWHGKTASYGS